MRTDMRINLERELFNPNSPISHVRVDVRAKLMRGALNEFFLEVQEKIYKRAYHGELDEFLEKQQKRFFIELKERLKKALENELRVIRGQLIREYPEWKDCLEHSEWKNFERSFMHHYDPRDLHKLFNTIKTALSEEPKTVKEVEDGLNKTLEDLKRLRRSVSTHAHYLTGADSWPLVYHLDHAIEQVSRHIKALNSKAHKWWAGYLDRHSPQSEERDKARRLLILTDVGFYFLGYEVLARLVRIVTNNPSYDKRFVQSVLSEKRKERKANPLIQEVIRDRLVSLEKNARIILFGE